MAELSALKKNVDSMVTIFPYREVSDENWPEYMDKTGNYVPYPKGWKDVGYVCLYPTVERLQHLRDMTNALKVESKSTIRVDSGNVKTLYTFCTTTIIRDVINVEENGQAVNYASFKRDLVDQFSKSSFLFRNFLAEYRTTGGRIMDQDVEDNEDFLGEFGESLEEQKMSSGQDTSMEEASESHTEA